MSAQLEQIERSTALAPAARAAIALDSAKHRKDLAELVKKSANIITVLNSDAREEAHRAGMVLKNARVNIQKRGKEAREDATAFSKAVIAEEKTLVEMIEPEEERILALRDAWDAKVEAERQAKIEAERQRVAAIQERILAIREHGTDAAHSTTAAETQVILTHLEQVEITAEAFQEMAEMAEKAKAETLTSVQALLQRRVEQEAEAARLKAAQEAEAARLQAEREELARQLAQQKAETEAAQAAAKAERDAAEARARAEREAAQAELKAAQDKMNAQLEQARVEREAESRRAAAMQAQIDAMNKAEADRKQAEADRLAAQAAAAEAAARPAPVVNEAPAAIVAPVVANFEPQTVFITARITDMKAATWLFDASGTAEIVHGLTIVSVE